MKIDIPKSVESLQSFVAGLRAAAQFLSVSGVLLPIMPEETKQERCVRFALAMAVELNKQADRITEEMRK